MSSALQAKNQYHVDRIQSVLVSLAVRVRDDTEFATEARSDPRSRDNGHGKF